MDHSRRSPLAWIFSAILAIAFVAAFVIGLALTVNTAHASAVELGHSAQILATATGDAAAEGADALGGVITALEGKVPSWIWTALSIYASFSLAYQALIAWWHKRIAETTSDTDDQWTQKLERATWFKILDRIFYVGGYLGAWLGKKKL